MLVREFDYQLPRQLIAQHPARARDTARLMVLDRAAGVVSHKVFRELPQLLSESDLLVLNETRVFPGRLFGHRSTGGKTEVLILGQAPDGRLRTLLRTRGKVRPGEIFSLASDRIRIRVLEEDDTGTWFFEPLTRDFEEKLEQLGEVPLPPYISRDYPSDNDSEDRLRYQTVFARRTGSAAAPTAGFHFTPALLDSLNLRGVEVCFLTLHIGYETFRPVKEETVEKHVMHSEYFCVGPGTLRALQAAGHDGRRVVAVGTTTCRVLETIARTPSTAETQRKRREPQREIMEKSTKQKNKNKKSLRNSVISPRLCGEEDGGSGVQGWTDIFIYPGFEFKTVGALITNFHLPRSTLLMLVAAFAGTNKILSAYKEAVRLKYRFYSYGDAMLIT